jgi:hypothetical protein
MRNGIILQVQGLGVPVQMDSDRVEAGFVVGWSSDVDCPTDAPAHVLIGSKEVDRFLRMAVDPRFQQAGLIQVIAVEVGDEQTAISRQDCIHKYQISPDNWNSVRTALVIAGNSPKGPVMDTMEWIGTRQEYAEGAHMREAFQHASTRGMKAVTLYTQQEGGHILNAADFIHGFRRQMKPSLRYAELLRQQIESAVIDMDCNQIHGERAVHVLRQIQNAFRHEQEQQLCELQDLGMDTAKFQRTAQEVVEELDSPNARKPRGPSLH